MTTNNCIFCKIIAGEIPATKILENDKVFAFLDIRPVNPGHVLVIPKAHHEMMTGTPDELVSEVFITAKKIMTAIKQALRADYVAVSVVGTEVPHFHVHLIPRYFRDNMEAFWPTKEYGKKEQMREVAERIVKEIN